MNTRVAGKRQNPSYKSLMSSYFWARTFTPEVLNYGYNCTSCHSILIGWLIYLRSEGIVSSYVPRHVEDKVDEYFGPRLRERTLLQEPVIKLREFRINDSTMFKGTAYVASRRQKVMHHIVRFSTIEHKDASEGRRLKAFRFNHFNDSCEHNFFLLYGTVPYVRRPRDEKDQIIDSRCAIDVPPPIVENVLCYHSWGAWFSLMKKLGCESYGIDRHLESIFRFEIGNVLDRKTPLHEVDKYLMEKTVLLQGFKEWERKKI